MAILMTVSTEADGDVSSITSMSGIHGGTRQQGSGCACAQAITKIGSVHYVVCNFEKMAAVCGRYFRRDDCRGGLPFDKTRHTRHGARCAGSTILSRMRAASRH